MKVAIVGSRNIQFNTISDFIPINLSEKITEIITGGAAGIDSLAIKYAKENNIKITIIEPEYKRYKKAAPLMRNQTIVDLSDYVLAIWDGKSKGTKYTIDYANKINKKIKVYKIN